MNVEKYRSFFITAGIDTDETKRTRAKIDFAQLCLLESAFNRNSKPNREMKEKLGDETGLGFQVVQVRTLFVCYKY